MVEWNNEFDAIVVGSGFGGAVAVTKMARQGLQGVEKPRILVLERGTWWRNPEGPGLRKDRKKKPLKIDGNWQYWARPRHAKGLRYIANSVYKEVNPLFDHFDPRYRDNDAGIRKNRKGMYRLTSFRHEHGSVDVVSGSAVGGGSLFYSGVNLIPHHRVLQRIGLGHLTSEGFRCTGAWMKKFRGNINKINTKAPVHHYQPEPDEAKAHPKKYYQLSAIPESGDAPAPVGYEMPEPKWLITVKKKGGSPGETVDVPRPDADFLLLDRARVLKRALERVSEAGGFKSGGVAGEIFDEDGSGGFKALPLSVVEYSPPTLDEFGQVMEKADTDSNDKNTFCTREGRCALGCLPSARHTLYKTIQKEQTEEGAPTIEILPLSKVSHISKTGDGKGFVVNFQSFGDDDDGGRRSANAPKVFLGAGCLGTTEILLRSKQIFGKSDGKEGLALSARVGDGFSTNGDFFAFTHNMPRDFKTRNQVKADQRIGNANPTVGPINSSHFYVSFGSDDAKRVDVNVEDAGIPTSIAPLVHALLPHFDDLGNMLKVSKVVLGSLLGELAGPDPEKREQSDYQTARELLANVFFYNLMGAGPSEPLGRFSLQPDGAGLDLSYVSDRKLSEWDVFKKHESVLKQLHEAMVSDKGDEKGPKPKLSLSPFWQTKDKVVTVVHPLGGACVGPDSGTGAIDPLGRVYDGSEGATDTAVHDGLYVVDGAAIPGALGVNPTFTIVTHALHVMNAIVPPEVDV